MSFTSRSTPTLRYQEEGLQSEARNSYLGLDPLFSALDASSDSVEIADIEGSIMFVNDAWCRLFDRSRQDVVGARCETLQLGDADNAALYTSLARCVAYGYSEGAFRLKRTYHTGSTVFYTRALYRNAGGTAIAVMTIYRPLSSAMNVHRIPPLLIASLNRSAHGVLVADAFGYFANSNQVFLDLSGYQKEELFGLRLRDLFPHANEAMSSIDEGGGRWEGETSVTRKDGSSIPLSLSITPIRDAYDATVGFVIRIKPISVEATPDKSVSVSGSQAKVHKQELQNLLAAITGNIETMGRMVEDENLQERLTLIRSAARSGIDMLSEIEDSL